MSTLPDGIPPAKIIPSISKDGLTGFLTTVTSSNTVSSFVVSSVLFSDGIGGSSCTAEFFSSNSRDWFFSGLVKLTGTFPCSVSSNLGICFVSACSVFTSDFWEEMLFSSRVADFSSVLVSSGAEASFRSVFWGGILFFCFMSPIFADKLSFTSSWLYVSTDLIVKVLAISLSTFFSVSDDVFGSTCRSSVLMLSFSFTFSSELLFDFR